MKKTKALLALATMTAVSCGLAGATRATYALAPALDSSRNAVTTVPAGIDASAKSKNPNFNPVVERYAADKHISVDMAAQWMDREYELTQFADRHRKDEAYAGFKGSLQPPRANCRPTSRRDRRCPPSAPTSARAHPLV